MAPDSIEAVIKTVMETRLGLPPDGEGEINITVPKMKFDGIQIITANITTDDAKYKIRMTIDHALRMTSIDSYKLVDSQVLSIDE
jgi:hypothetical protein